MNASPIQSPRSIAVVDDVVEMRDLLRQWLGTIGHVVACASDGRELVDLASRQHFDLIITDVNMPEVDGFEVITAMKRIAPDVPILAMSGGGEIMSGRDYLAVAKRLGADGILLKPFNRAQLLAAVDTTLASAV